MKRKLRTLVAIVSALAASAAFAAGAQSASFTASSYPATFTGEQAAPHVWTVQGTKIECSSAHFEGSLTAASESAKIVPTYSGCTSFGIANSEIDMNGCYYELTTGETMTLPAHRFEGSTHFRCPEGQTATVSTPASNPLCVVHVGEQTPTSSKVDLENVTSNTVRLTYTTTGWHSNVTDIAGFFCPLSNASTDATGSWTGTIEFKGNGGKTIDVG